MNDVAATELGETPFGGKSNMPNGNEALEADVRNLKEQSADNLRRVEKEQKELRQEIEKLAAPVHELEVKAATQQQAFEALENTIKAASTRVERQFGELIIRIDNLANLREGENSNAMDWAKLFIICIVGMIFLYWLKTGA